MYISKYIHLYFNFCIPKKEVVYLDTRQLGNEILKSSVSNFEILKYYTNSPKFTNLIYIQSRHQYSLKTRQSPSRCTDWV